VRLIRILLIFTALTLFFPNPITAQNTEIEIIPIAHDLNNPRGVAILPDGQLIVAETGIGTDLPSDVTGSGRILQLSDNNADGDFDDEGERTIRLDAQPSYNSLTLFRTGHDEPFGLGDVLALDSDRIFYTLDNPFAELDRNTDDLYYGDVGIFKLNAPGEEVDTIVARSATLNSFTYDPVNDLFYVTESGFNRIMSTDMEGNVEVVVEFPVLANEQQAVPSGVAYDPSTGDILIALLSGFVHNYYETQLGFMPGDAKVMRFNLDRGELTEEITGLTTAIDVTVDESGNIFVAELTTTWAPIPMPIEFDLFDPNLPPDPGGYARYTGRVMMYPVDGEAIILADRIDTPTNLTYHDGALYVSTGLGTPGRSIISSDGITQINGIIYRITGF